MKRFLSTLCALVVILGLLPFWGRAASSGEIREEISALQEEAQALAERQDALEAQLADTLEEIEDIVAQKNIIDQQIALLQEQIRNTWAQISAQNQLIADNQDALDAAKMQLEQLRAANKARIRAMEEGGSLNYWAVIFQAESFTDLLDRVNMIREIAEADRSRMEKLAEAARAVENAQLTLETEKKNLEQFREKLHADEVLLEEKREQADALLRELISRGAEFEALLAEMEAQEQTLLEEIAQKEEELDKAEYQEWLATYVPPAPETGGGNGGTVNTSGWCSPLVSYTLTSPFGMRTHPITGEYKMHNGIDMAAPEGTPIYAAKGGQVSIAAYSASAGNYVQINHGDGYRSVYMHMTGYTVKPGQYVAQGQLIGYVGNTGASKGNHLHFGISLNGSYVNPVGYIR
ncbi:MAG: peptidoglycan DD-metalloendopeptidase family protein [Oscillospiraceae bacterium]|nr:peptidoglycan DD-metalloendopeptidase family protein [Oscillospiraceae bacterium]